MGCDRGDQRFVPFVGAFIAAAFPTAVAVAVDPGWSLALWTIGLFLLSEPLVGYMVEP
jgi:predicted PurR-regulated permease PerM